MAPSGTFNERMFEIASQDPEALNLHYYTIIQVDSTLKTDFRKAVKPKKRKVKPLLKPVPTHLKACSLHGIARHSDDEREAAANTEATTDCNLPDQKSVLERLARTPENPDCEGAKRNGVQSLGPESGDSTSDKFLPQNGIWEPDREVDAYYKNVVATAHKKK